MAEEEFKAIIGGSPSREDVAFKLMERILNIPSERKEINREKVLDTYASCLEAVKGNRKPKA